MKNTTEKKPRPVPEFSDLKIDETTLPLLETIAEGMPGGFFIYRATGDEEFIYFNTCMLKLYGCKTREEFISLTGNSFTGMVHPVDIDRVEKEIAEQIQRNENAFDHVYYRGIKKNGEILHVNDYGHLVSTKTYGDIFYVFVDDITKTGRIEILEAAIRKEEKINRQLAVIADLTEDFECVNYIALTDKPETDTVTQYRVSDYLLKIIPDWETVLSFTKRMERLENYFVHPDDKALFHANTRREVILKNLETSPACYVEFRAEIDGALHYYEIKFTAVKEDDGIKAMVSGIHNIDERYAAEQKDAEHLSVISALSRDFGFVFFVDWNTMQETVYRFDERYAPYFKDLTPGARFDERLAFTIKHLVAESDRTNFAQLTERTFVLKELQKNPVHFVNFTAVFGEKTERWQ
ncbi:MAG TPA: PAS domain-containing protein, partial [Methanocorpusculum sp.]|nr:PAS domain-containing protein [Methanocorpusculum sp.]